MNEKPHGFIISHRVGTRKSSWNINVWSDVSPKVTVVHLKTVDWHALSQVRPFGIPILQLVAVFIGSADQEKSIRSEGQFLLSGEMSFFFSSSSIITVLSFIII